MQNFNFEIRFLSEENKEQIKNLWKENFFEDEEKIIEKFLEKVFENEKGVGAFFENKLIGMVLFLNSKIVFKNKKYNSAYFYAVCTNEKYRKKGVMASLFEFAEENLKKQGVEICFLVPENESLFKMYEKLGYESKAFYKDNVVSRKSFNGKNTLSPITDFCYNNYKTLKETDSKKYPLVLWGESEFDFIFNRERTDVSFMFLKTGYVIYEKREAEVLVHELCGNENDLLKVLFSNERNCERIILRKPTSNRENKFGMAIGLSEPKLIVDSFYLGIAYG